MIKFIHFIGSLLIGLAALIKFIHKTLIFFLIVGIVVGIFMITMISFFDLLSPEMNVLGKTYWDVIVLIIGSATMWLGISKLGVSDKPITNNLTIK